MTRTVTRLTLGSRHSSCSEGILGAGHILLLDDPLPYQLLDLVVERQQLVLAAAGSGSA
ncbi:MAG: hypothetical protein ABIS06_08940 [Vicinamibacterales bacterium]